MSSSISVPPVPDSVLSQIVRAGSRTLGAVAVVALLVLGVVYGAAPASDAWARVAGDPDLVLADGVRLSSEPASITVPTLRPLGIDEARAALASALGGPVELLPDAAAAAARYPDQVDLIRSWPVSGSESLLATPAGPAFLSVDPTRGLRVAVPEVDPTWHRVAPGQQEEFARSLVAAAGAPGGVSASGDPYVPTLITDGTGAAVVLLEDPTWLPTGIGDRVDVAADGRVTSIMLYLHRAEGSREVGAVAAAEAWDRLRHHDGLWSAWGETPPVHVARLASDADGRPWWLFLDESGMTVAEWSEG
jgi:hypothetical protein